jgi:ligand-binding sensor domain-containing protein
VEETNGDLPSDQIYALWVDDGQAVWVGTDAGLSRYDGLKWDTYTDTLASKDVRALSNDGAGGLWVGTIGGLSHFDGSKWQTQTLTTADGLTDNWVKALALDDERGLWIGTLRGSAHFDGKQVDLQISTLDDQRLGSARAVLPTEAGGAYLAVENEVIYVSRKEAPRRYGAPAGLDGGWVQALADAGGGELWVGTEKGLYRFTRETFVPISLADGAGGTEPDILSLAEDGAGGLWLGTSEGLLHFDGERVDVRLTAQESGLAADRVRVIHRTEDGTLWLGTTGGVSRWNPEAWRAFPAAGLNIWAIAGQGERVWATSEQGVAVWDGQDWNLLTETRAYGLWPDGDAVWFGSAEGLQRRDSDGVTTVENKELAGHPPRVIARNDSGDLWAGTDDGLFHLREGALVGEYHQIDGLVSDFVNALMIEPEMIWVGTIEGLVLGDGRTWTTVTWGAEIHANRVRALARGADGSLWVGTEAGLRRLRPDGDPVDASAWLLYTNEDGLASDAVNALWVEPNGQLWVGTDGGLSGLDDNSTLDRGDDIWVSLTRDEGLNANRVTALWRDTQGALWIGTEAGVVRHVPNLQAPSLGIAGIRAEGKLWPLWPELTLEWDQVDVDLEFKGASLATGELVYRYQLSGDDWQVTRERRTGMFLEAAGHYDFVVEVLDSDLNPSPTASATFSVQNAPLWARRWVQVAALLAGLGLIGAVVALGPGGRWWRAYQRATYRESWEVEFIQTHPDSPGFTVHAQQSFKRDLRLFAEGQGTYFLSLTGETIVAPHTLPTDLELRHETWRSTTDPDDPAPFEALARPLAAALLPKDMPQRLQNAVARRNYRARLRLNFAGAPALAVWPWEVTQPPGLEPLGLNPATAISHWLPSLGQAESHTDEADPNVPLVTPIPQNRNLVILLVVASPRMPPAFKEWELPQLDVTTERKRLEEALEGKRATIRVLAGVRAEGKETEFNMQEALNNELVNQEEGPPDVVHFIGHADFHPRKPDEIVLYLEDQRGMFYPLGASDLVNMIRDSQKLVGGPRMLVLNACRTAEINGAAALEGLVPQLITQTGLMAVVGMQYKIEDDAAAAFASTFYRELVQTQPVDYAVAVARRDISRLGGHSWAAPVLYMQVADGMIYEP